MSVVTQEDLVWQNINPDHMWVLDKLILSKKMGHDCGPVGIDVNKPGKYIVRPCVNPIGLGLGSSVLYLQKDTTHLPIGYFWCEWFDGDHISIDYVNGEQVLAVQGFKTEDTFTKWDRWSLVNKHIPLPDILREFVSYYDTLNCEFIGDKLIEVHFRRNEDFDGDVIDFIPVWEGENTNPPADYKYREYPDVHGRIGAFIKCGTTRAKSLLLK